MSKLLKTIGIIFLIIFISVILFFTGLIIFLKNSDVQKYKPQIIKIASNSLNRTVDFSDIEIDISLKNGFRIRVSDFIIADDPGFSGNSFISIKDIEAGINIIPSFSARRISIPNILIKSPVINVVRREKGFNFETLSELQNTSNNHKGYPKAIIPAFLIDSLRIENGEIYYSDKTTNPKTELFAKKLNFDLKRVSLVNPFDFLFEGAILSDEKNIKIGGSVLLNAITRQARFSNTRINADIQNLPLEFFNSLNLFTVPEIFKGNLFLIINEAIVSEKGLVDLNTSIYFKNGQIAAENIVPGISFDARHIDFEIENFRLDANSFADFMLKASLYNQNTNIDLKGKASFDFKSNEFHVKNSQFLTDLSLWDTRVVKNNISLIEDTPLPQNLSGKLQVDVKDLRFSAAGLKNILFDVNLEKASFDFTNIFPDANISLKNTDLIVKDLSFNKPISFSLSTAYLNNEQNIHFNGILAADLFSGGIRLKDSEVLINLDKIPMKEFKGSGLVKGDIAMPEILKGNLQMKINNMFFSLKGLENIKADISWKDGKVQNYEISPGISFSSPNLNLDINDFNLITPFSFTLKFAYSNENPNIEMKGKALYQKQNQNVILSDTTVDVDLANFSIEQIKNSVLPLKDISFPEKIKGKLKLEIAQMSAGLNGFSEISAKTTLKDWEIVFKELAAPITGKEFNLVAINNDILVDSINLYVGKGQIKGNLEIKEYTTKQNFDFSSEILAISLREILKQEDFPVKIEGILDGKLKLKGNFKELSLITGEGNFEIKQAKLINLNLLKTTLDKISFIPDVYVKVERNLPKEYKEKLSDNDTNIELISGSLNIFEGKITIDPVYIQSDEFTFSGKGIADFKQNYSLEGIIRIPEKLSQAMAEGLSELEYLYDKNNNISLPVYITGQGSQYPVLVVTQTALDVGKNILRSQGKKELEKIFDKILGVEKESSDTQLNTNGEKQDSPANQKQNFPVDEIINGIFNQIFK